MNSNDKKQLSGILAKRQAAYGEKNVMYTSLFMLSIFVIGIVLTVVSWDIDNKIEKLKCTSSALKSANKYLLVIGVTFIVSSLAFYGCATKCGNIKGVHYSIYLMVLFLLGIVLIVLGSIIQSNSVDECANAGSPTIIWVLGVFIVLGSGLYFYSRYKK